MSQKLKGAVNERLYLDALFWLDPLVYSCYPIDALRTFLSSGVCSHGNPLFMLTVHAYFGFQESLNLACKSGKKMIKI